MELADSPAFALYLVDVVRVDVGERNGKDAVGHVSSLSAVGAVGVLLGVASHSTREAAMGQGIKYFVATMRLLSSQRSIGL